MIITAFYAGLLGVWFFILSLHVVRGRRQGIYLGDGGNPLMLRKIRGHANFAEYVPFILLMMALLEMGRTSIYVLHALGITLVIARLLHGYALSFTRHFFLGRFLGAALTFTVLLVSGILCLLQGIRGMQFTM